MDRQKQSYLECPKCLGGQEGDGSCKIAGDDFGCLAGVPLELAQNVLGTSVYRRLQKGATP